MTEDKLANIQKNYSNPLAQYKVGYQLSKVIIIVLSLALLTSLGINFTLAGKRQLVVGIDSNMLPVPLRVKKMNLERLIDYKQFLISFLNRLYYWDTDTFQSQKRLALGLMTSEVQKQYIEIVENEPFTSLIKDGKMISAITPLKISDQVEKYKDGYITELEANKIRIINHALDRVSRVKFRIAFRSCEANDENFWGFEVFELTEIDITDNGKDGRK
jgi:hypothetical protein